MKALALLLVSLLLTGCAINTAVQQRGRVISVLQTVVGLDVSQNPVTGLYSARLGLVRNEMVIVLDGSNDVPVVNIGTDVRNGNGIFQNSSVARRVMVGNTISTNSVPRSAEDDGSPSAPVPPLPPLAPKR